MAADPVATRARQQVVDALGPAAATELTFDMVRNAANKIAVAFNVDEPRVETGVEYYDIDMATGQLRYDVTGRPAPEAPVRDQVGPVRHRVGDEDAGEPPGARHRAARGAPRPSVGANHT